MAPFEQRIGAQTSLRGLVGKQDDPYAGADRDNASRIVGLLWLLSGALTIAFLPFDAPTEAIASAGWALAGATVVAAVAGARRLVRKEPPLSFDALLAVSYIGLAQVALLVWLAGGAGSAYQNLFLLWLGSAMGVHPPRRALAFLAATAAVAALPLAYDGWSSGSASEIAPDFLLWAAMGLIVMALMMYVRAQRVTLADEGERAQRLARADELTGLGNRRAFDEALEAEMARAGRAGSTLSVALVDVDNFKELNDVFGHMEGDRCLTHVASVITHALRGGDRAFRWGGDEFALLLPDTGFEGAQRALERVAAAVCGGCASSDGRPLTISWGAAEMTGDMGASELVGRADLALLAHKQMIMPGAEARTTEPAS